METKILKQILENQKSLSLAVRRLIPHGENVDTPALLNIETQCKESIQKLSPTKISNIELKLCPFCGNTPKLHELNKNGNEDVQCLNCGAKIEKAVGVGVIDAWNRRC